MNETPDVAKAKPVPVSPLTVIGKIIGFFLSYLVFLFFVWVCLWLAFLSYIYVKEFSPWGETGRRWIPLKSESK